MSEQQKEQTDGALKNEEFIGNKVDPQVRKFISDQSVDVERVEPQYTPNSKKRCSIL